MMGQRGFEPISMMTLVIVIVILAVIATVIFAVPLAGGLTWLIFGQSIGNLVVGGACLIFSFVLFSSAATAAGASGESSRLPIIMVLFGLGLAIVGIWIIAPNALPLEVSDTIDAPSYSSGAPNLEMLSWQVKLILVGGSLAIVYLLLERPQYIKKALRRLHG